MSTAPPHALASAEEVCRRFDASDDARALCSPGLSIHDFLTRLLQKGLFPDALSVAAHLLPNREAVWWGALCVWHACRPKPGEKVDAALRAVVTWLREPSEANRRAAKAAGEAVTAATPAGAVAMAAFYSEGSLSEPELPEVKPPPSLAQTTVAAAVQLTASLAPPEQFESVCGYYVNMAVEVRNGKHPWK
jgi:hypothetical protein